MKNKRNSIPVIVFSAIVLLCLPTCQKEDTNPYNNGNCNYINYSGSNSCATGNVAVTSGTCCPAAYPYYCANINWCYELCSDASAHCNGSVVKGSSGSGNCNYTTYSGSGSCTTGSVAVTSGTCCPVAYPYYCANNNSCYATCSDAAASCNGSVIKGSTGSGNCNYTTYSGSGSCSSGNVLVTSTTCCPSSSPYYCANTNQCYSTCSAAEANCSGSVIFGNTGGTGGNCNWNSAVSCVTVTQTDFGTRCGDPQSFEITLKNNCTQSIKPYVCLQKTDGTWVGNPDGSFSTGMAPNATANWFVCKGTGAYKIFAMPISTYNANTCAWPSCN